MNHKGPKVKLSRSLGIPLTPKAARIMERRSYPPGDHGRSRQFRNKSESAYKEQLLEKQRLRAQYNVSEKQMRIYFAKARQRSGLTSVNLIQLLESRLDAVVLHGGLAITIYAARQYVSHGHIQVNGRKVNIPSYQLKPGDEVSVRRRSRHLDCFKDDM
jgi:small subunit ribosomal protein S4